MANFIRAANPIWYFVDLQGLGLNDEFYISFLTNTFPYLPQNVYEDVNGTTPWQNPLEFFPNGTLPDNLYFDEDLVYRLEIRRGPLQSDPLIYEINNFVAGTGGGINPTDLDILSADNQVSNSQFSQINFVSPLTITTAGTHSIAPGWDLILTGVGTTIVTQIILSGDQNILDNPPYALRINNTGWTTAILQQRLDNNGAIWANGAIAFSLLGRAETVSEIVTVNYVPNAPGTPQSIVTGTLTTGNYAVLQGAIDLNASTNTSTSDVAYVDIQIVLPGTGTVDISNIQLVGQSSPLPANFSSVTDIPNYIQEPIERQIDHLFHYYRDSLVKEAKDNLLAGWTFGLNPWQFITPSQTLVAAQTEYVADQTILHQETAGALTSGRGGGGINFGIQFVAVNGVMANRFAMIQYIDKETMRPYWGQNLSVLARCGLFTAHATVTKLKARLIYRANIPPAIGAAEPITGWDANGDITFAAGWTAVEPQNDVDYTLTPLPVGPAENNLPGHAFEKFILPSAPSSTAYVGLVLYITAPINETLGTEDVIAFDRVSLVPNDFAIDASPETWDESLRKCQYYYEKSYQQSVLPGTFPAAEGSLLARTVLSPTFPAQFHPFSFGAPYAYKCRVPTLLLYSPVTGASSVVSAQLLRNGGFAAIAGGSNPNPSDLPMVGNYTINVSQNGFFAVSAITTTNYIEAAVATSGDEGCFFYQYTADARLGV